MSRMGSTKAGRRARRQFSEEFRIGAVRLVLDAGKTGLTTEERADLARLRKDNPELRMERDVLKKAAVSSKGRCNAMNDHGKEGSWVAFVVHGCQQERRWSCGSGGSAVSRSATSVGHSVGSREQFTTSCQPVGVSRRRHGPGRDARSP